MLIGEGNKKIKTRTKDVHKNIGQSCNRSEDLKVKKTFKK